MSTGTTLAKVVTSTPADIRLVISYVQNGECVIEVLDCVSVLAMTYDTNGTPTTILCYNPNTGQNEVVAIVDGTDTQQVTFDLERLLPKYAMSRILKLVRENCGLAMWLIRGDKCVDPLNPNDYIVAEVFGGDISLTNYTRTQHLYYNKADAAEVVEGTSVTAYQWLQVNDMPFGTRGGLHTVPIVDIALCDTKACGGICDDDSDGCQKWFVVDELGTVGWTEDNYVTENIEANLPGQLTAAWPPTTIACAYRGQIVVTDANGTLWYANIDDIVDDGSATWSSLALDVNGDDIGVINDVYYDKFNKVNWYVGNTNTLYVYDPSYTQVTPVTTIPGLVNDLLKIAKYNDHLLLGGTDGVLMQSLDNGNSFQLITVIDPLTGVALAPGIDITALGILSARNYIVGTSDDRTLYTLDGGQTWHSMLIYNSDGGSITDMAWVNTAVGTHIGYMIRNDAATGRGHMYQTIYGTCLEWIEVPKDSAKILPDNGGLVEMLICPDDHNKLAAVGQTTAGAGMIVTGQPEYI